LWSALPGLAYPRGARCDRSHLVVRGERHPQRPAHRNSKPRAVLHCSRQAAVRGRDERSSSARGSTEGILRSGASHRVTTRQSMRSIERLSVLAGLRLGAIPPALAHHAFASQFDATKPVTLEGRVTMVEWRNPHIWVYLDVESEDGSVTAWECEGGAPNALTRQGWTSKTLRLGSTLTIEGYLAKNGTNTCNARTWIYEGRRIFAGSADGGPAPRGSETPQQGR